MCASLFRSKYHPESWVTWLFLNWKGERSNDSSSREEICSLIEVYGLRRGSFQGNLALRATNNDPDEKGYMTIGVHRARRESELANGTMYDLVWGSKYPEI